MSVYNLKAKYQKKGFNGKLMVIPSTHLSHPIYPKG